MQECQKIIQQIKHWYVYWNFHNSLGGKWFLNVSLHLLKIDFYFKHFANKILRISPHYYNKHFSSQHQESLYRFPETNFTITENLIMGKFINILIFHSFFLHFSFQIEINIFRSYFPYGTHLLNVKFRSLFFCLSF